MSKVALLKCENYEYDSVLNQIKTAVDLLGGFDSFINKNDKVFIKLNCVGPFAPELGITSHPVFVKRLSGW